MYKRQVVKRAIHTTADFDYARNLVFTPGAVEAGVRALRAGTPILTDTNMARSGINRGALERLGISVHCFMADPEVARRAAEAGTCLLYTSVLGISSGASLGAVLAMLVGVWLPMGRLSVPAGAFVGALVSILLVYGLSRSGGAVTPVRLILVGVAVSAMFQAFTNYLVYTAPDDAAVREATFWMLGGLGSAKWEDLPLLALILPPLFLVLMALARPLNAMLMGDSSAVTLGVDLDRVRGVLILSSALLTASAVAVSGCIGFVGLVIPHLVRSVVGADHRRLIPLSALCGAVFMIWMDVGARLAVRPEEIPVGIITAFIGAPLFLWMIRVRRYEF